MSDFILRGPSRSARSKTPDFLPRWSETTANNTAGPAAQLVQGLEGMRIRHNAGRHRIGFALEPASSVMEKRIFVGLLARKSVRYGQRATLVGLQRNFLCQHDVACDEVTFRRKAPTNTRTTGAVELVDVHRGAVPNPV